MTAHDSIDADWQEVSPVNLIVKGGDGLLRTFLIWLISHSILHHWASGSVCVHACIFWSPQPVISTLFQTGDMQIQSVHKPRRCSTENVSHLLIERCKKLSKLSFLWSKRKVMFKFSLYMPDATATSGVELTMTTYHYCNEHCRATQR